MRKRKNSSSSHNKKNYNLTPSPRATSLTSIAFKAAIYQLAKLWLKFPLQTLSIAGPCILLVLLGLNQTPTAIPLLDFVKMHRIIALIIGIILVLVTIFALLFSYLFAPQPKGSVAKQKVGNTQKNLASNTSNSVWIVITLISTISFLLSASLLTIILLQPSWCPSVLCLNATYSFPTDSVSDNNLILYPFAVQSSAYVIPGDPSNYQKALPEEIVAQRIDRPIPSTPYRLILGVQSRIHTQDSILISSISVIIKQILPNPRPLNIWDTTLTTSYNNNPFAVIYGGQQPEESLRATSMTVPRTLVHLIPGETDHFALQITSHVPVNLWFQVQITYIKNSDPQPHTLLLSKVFQAIFSDVHNWKSYRLHNGTFESNP